MDISDCLDLGPVLIALAALKNGAILTGTDRLKIKESDRGQVMHEELQKLGGGLIFGENTITVPKLEFGNAKTVLDGHNDHRIVMAFSIGAAFAGKQSTVTDAEAINKSYPKFFEDLKQLGADVNLI